VSHEGEAVAHARRPHLHVPARHPCRRRVVGRVGDAAVEVTFRKRHLDNRRRQWGLVEGTTGRMGDAHVGDTPDGEEHVPLLRVGRPPDAVVVADLYGEAADDRCRGPKAGPPPDRQ